MMSNPVEAQWIRLISQKLPRTLEVDPDLELRLVCGTDHAGQPIFCSISRIKPGIPELSDAVDVTRAQRNIDGHWVLLLTLKAARFTDVFVQLCSHIVDRVTKTSSEAQGLAALMASVEEWRKLIQRPRGEQLSIEGTRGLFGELWLGFSKLAQKSPVHQVMDAWHGPFHSDQDFQFPNGPLIEVKTVHSRTRRVQISSENQLSRQPNEHLFLCVLAVDDVTFDTPDALTVPALLDNVDRMLREAGVAESELSRRLVELGYDRFDDAYDDIHFLPISVRYLEVTDSFPRIESQMLPDSVSRVSYSLDLADLGPFDCDLSQLGLPTTALGVQSSES